MGDVRVIAVAYVRKAAHVRAASDLVKLEKLAQRKAQEHSPCECADVCILTISILGLNAADLRHQLDTKRRIRRFLLIRRFLIEWGTLEGVLNEGKDHLRQDDGCVQ
jgi:hypothetical protein